MRSYLSAGNVALAVLGDLGDLGDLTAVLLVLAIHKQDALSSLAAALGTLPPLGSAGRST